MDQQTIYTLIQKYKDNTASEAEKKALLEWYRETAYRDADFPESEDSVGDMMLDRLNKQTQPVVKKVSYVKWFAAASVLLILGIGGFWIIKTQQNSTPNKLTALSKHDIAPGSNKAILILANGSQISLTDAGNGKIAGQNGIQITKTANGQLVYTIKEPDNSKAQSNEGASSGLLVYNTIQTPKGGQYQVTLPDGSKVWLNAFSSLKFPVSFSAQKERRVELVGEAYFEVEHNKDLPFRVVSNKQVVEVLGTHFDINAYPDEASTKTTLLQGSVRLTAANSSTILKPGQQASLAGSINISDVNTEDAIAWKNGYFKFDDEKLENIMRSVSRWYNVDVVFQDESLKNETFGAVTTRFSNISTLLNMMEQTGDADFRIDGSTIRISKKK